MKKLLLITLLLVVASIPCFITATAQTLPPVQNYINVYPNSPTSEDSLTIAFVYESGDACPDYYLVKDSVVSNRIYVNKKSIENTGLYCAQVITKFETTLNLGILSENTQIYFEGALVKTIHFVCNMDRIGEVVAGTGDCIGQIYIKETTVYLSAIPRLFAFPKTYGTNTNSSNQPGLKEGDKVKFGGSEILSDSNTISPCKIVGFVNCCEVVAAPPVGCVKDKKGIVVTGQGDCSGELFIQEYSPISSTRQLYSIQGGDSINSNGTVTSGLKVGDQVLFGGYPVNKDSITNTVCNTVGIATCYEVISNPPACVMDKVGTVTEFKDNSTLVKDSVSGDIYAINNIKLAIGSKVRFKGTKIECITTPCYNIIECYELIDNPQCIPDKTGVIVAGIGGCTGQLFIRNTSSVTNYSQIYAIKATRPINDTSVTGLKPGDKVRFGGYLIKNDSTLISLCHIDGIATCYEQMITPPPCMMDKKGVVVAGKNGCAGQLFIQEYSPINSYPQLYLIKGGDTLNNSGSYSTFLKEGDVVTFGGYPTLNDSSATNACRTVGVANCYQVISTPPACIMDKSGIVTELKDNSTLIKENGSGELYAIKNITLPIGTQIKFKGVKIECFTTPCYNPVECYTVVDTTSCVLDKKGIVVTGTNDCSGQLFIEEITPYMSMVRRLYEIRNIDASGKTNPIGLKAGDQVQFGGYLTPNDSNMIKLCHTIGVATCYSIIETPPACLMDKRGVVVPGIDGCTGQLFIQDTTYPTTYPQLYSIENPAMTNSSIPVLLKAGDKVRFGGYPVKNDSTFNILCPIAGKATCYELLSSDNIYTLSGSVYAGNSFLKSGTVLLYMKGDRKATATFSVTDGTFAFTNLPKGEYTVYVIPSISLYKNYFPTFYISNYLFLNADYYALNSNVTDMSVHLKSYEYPVGTGKITGNIFFETYSLKDSLMADNTMIRMNNIPVNNSAVNTPVILMNYLNEPVAWTLTDIVGNYTFENIALGTYKVVTETASAKGESTVSLTPGNSTANADFVLKGLQTNTGTTNVEDIVISIYPNPVVDNLILTLKEDAKADLYNTVGQMLLNLNLKSGNNVVNLSTINRGVYFVKIGKSNIKVIKK